MLDLKLMGPKGGELAQVAFDGSRYYRTADGVYLKDFGHGDSKDDAKLHSGQMLDFDGVDDYVDTPCELVDGDDYTIAITFDNNLASGPNSSKIIINNWYGFAGINVSSGYHLEFRVRNNNEDLKIVFLNYVCEDISRLVLSVKNGGSVIIGINGVDRTADCIVDFGTNASIVTTNLTGNAFRIGANTLGSQGVDATSFIDGQIGNVQIWNAAFTADDVAFDYANLHHMKPAYENSNSALTADNLKGWWPLIEGSGDVAYDWSGNGNHGTLTNFPTDDTQWSNADALDSPLVPQTALLEWGMGSNLLPNSVNVSSWTMRGAGTIAESSESAPDGSSMILFSNLSTAGVGDVYSLISGGAADTLYNVGFFIKRVSTNYNIRITNPNGGTYGDMRINLSLLSDDIEYITVDHSAVTLINPFKTTSGGDFGFGVSSDTNNSISANIWGIQLTYSDLSATILTHAQPATNVLTPIRSWETAGQFLRNHGELNFNGRSYADAGNGVDVNPSSAVLLECVCSYNAYNFLEYITTDNSSVVKLYFYKTGRVFLLIKLEDGNSYYISIRGEVPLVEGTSYHLVGGYSKSSAGFYGYLNGVSSVYSSSLPATFQNTFSQNTTRVLGNSNPLNNDFSLLAQLPLFKMYTDAEAQAIIDGDLDAWVAKQYAKAQAKYGL